MAPLCSIRIAVCTRGKSSRTKGIIQIWKSLSSYVVCITANKVYTFVYYGTLRGCQYRKHLFHGKILVVHTHP